ncbi:hypothetical protein HPC49_02800 [Pyxidicoccus fallax]|uniref:Uncharacterized protein n=1 Tax=Pyxidicoccus fallax TaxID=394095 RepID=A0A848LCX0_9BACT|nr:hypothetical protein [Pyxidicoccus fallax]NMO13278.1 hypothetical protein [Pyxidicoccus fallax]NPC77184.1 hypothetical protein [Pyxidicoccus fallax]
MRDAVLLDAEATKLHDAVAAFLGGQKVGAKLVPPPEVRALAVLAASGRTVEDGPVCAKSPSLEELISRRHPGAASASITVTSVCGSWLAPKPSRGWQALLGGNDAMALQEQDRTCERRHVLEVRVVLPGPEDEPPRRLRWRTTVAHPETGDGWVSAVRQLREAPEPLPSYSILDVDREQGVELEYSVLLGAWGKRGPFFSRAPSGAAAVKPLRPALAEVEEAIQTCHVPGHGRSFVGLQIDPKGQVSACLPRSEEPTSPAHHACLCGAFARATFPASARERRLFVSVVNHHLPRGGSALAPASTRSPVPENRAWVLELPFESSRDVNDAAGACVKGKPLAAFEAPVTLSLASDGTVAGAAFELPPELAETRGCLVEAMRKARYVCPDKGAESVRARLMLEPPPAKK